MKRRYERTWSTSVKSRFVCKSGGLPMVRSTVLFGTNEEAPRLRLGCLGDLLFLEE